VFPNYRFPQEASALKILHSLITQLILDESNLRHLLISAHYEDYRQLNSSVDFARNLLRQVLDCLSEIYVVIDGLDEMQETERVLLLKAMLALSQDNRDVKILVSSRPEDDITRLLGQKTSSIQVHDANSSDIASYVDNRALYWINELSPGPSQAKDIRNLMRRIALNAQGMRLRFTREQARTNLIGMFLYARLLCDVVVLKSSIDGMEEAIDDLPNGLDEA
jgi:hypothetical protein